MLSTNSENTIYIDRNFKRGLRVNQYIFETELKGNGEQHRRRMHGSKTDLSIQKKLCANFLITGADNMNMIPIRYLENYMNSVKAGIYELIQMGKNVVLQSGC